MFHQSVTCSHVVQHSSDQQRDSYCMFWSFPELQQITGQAAVGFVHWKAPGGDIPAAKSVLFLTCCN